MANQLFVGKGEGRDKERESIGLQRNGSNAKRKELEAQYGGGKLLDPTTKRRGTEQRLRSSCPSEPVASKRTRMCTHARGAESAGDRGMEKR